MSDTGCEIITPMNPKKCGKMNSAGIRKSPWRPNPVMVEIT